jgi:REP element-mobilizing transposase RayT
MAHTYASNFIHCVFSTRERRSMIPAARIAELFAYLGGIARGKGFSLVATGGTANHIHLLFILPATCSLAHAVQKLKGSSSRWIFLAGRIRSVQRESFPGSGGEEVHSKPGGASPQTQF